MRIDLNSDVGESFGAYRIGADADLVPHVTSVNVACGFHGGDPGVMRETVRLARNPDGRPCLPPHHPRSQTPSPR